MPLAVAALLPFGEVARGDGVTVKLGLENGLYFREGVEPREDRFGFVAIAEAWIELFADLVRETSDFSGASHGIVGLMDEWIDGVVGVARVTKLHGYICC